MTIKEKVIQIVQGSLSAVYLHLVIST